MVGPIMFYQLMFADKHSAKILENVFSVRFKPRAINVKMKNFIMFFGPCDSRQSLIDLIFKGSNSSKTSKMDDMVTMPYSFLSFEKVDIRSKNKMDIIS